jgi:Cdc6-like AAA superfamily ATPase
MPKLDSVEVQALAKIVEESTRSTRESAKFFIEPAPGTLSRAKNRRHHIIFGRRGSGKSSLLAKVTKDLTISRRPTAYVDLEEFKGHNYPDVLLSILIKTLDSFKDWLETAATHPATKTSFWNKFFGASPVRKGFNRLATRKMILEIAELVAELNRNLFAADDIKQQLTLKRGSEEELKTAISGELKGAVSKVASKIEHAGSQTNERQLVSEYSSRKIELLHRNIMKYKSIFQQMTMLADGPAFLLLDDLYHIRVSDQASVIDYFHRIAKNTNLWLKVGTIRHRSKWYIFGNPPIGMKLGDDAEEIDLDVTLEKYDLTKKFLLRILDNFCKESNIRLDDILTDGARDRLVLASGGVARDFLTIFRRAIDVAAERLARKDVARGEKIGTEDVNKASGENDKFKREDFSRDTGGEDQRKLLSTFDKTSDFCIDEAKANCFLIDKEVSDQDVKNIAELVDLKFFHHVRSRVTVRERAHRIYDAYMLDLSQYAGERARRNFEIVEFWGRDAEDSIRKRKFIFRERPTPGNTSVS